ncbi:ATP-binding protein [Geoglobus acetivorans]|uniref:CO dehydrogenase accessory protein CooC (Nickel insertion) n=1 Tax=Geoglobus acetivorans TaxID=565033 RepID=A0A0A7GC63_GEOAI|nr:CO dehydrogenase accessory protein CooC (nickel insertion) [Geoglobus acetivorans]
MTVIAVTGKGGTGKTILSALLTHFISQTTSKVMAVDADPDSNLPDALGVAELVEKTLGEVRETFQVSRDEMGTANKEQWLEGRIYGEAICECDNYDLIVMGRPEGEGCYCYANSLLRGVLRKLMRHYEYIIIDSEAGLEHFSRKTIDSADYIVVVTDMSKKGLATAKRIKELSEELDLKFKDIFLVGNRITSKEAEETIRKFADEIGMKVLDFLPFDEKIAELDLKGEPVVNLPESSEYYQKAKKIAEMFIELHAKSTTK